MSTLSTRRMYNTNLVANTARALYRYGPFVYRSAKNIGSWYRGTPHPAAQAISSARPSFTKGKYRFKTDRKTKKKKIEKKPSRMKKIEKKVRQLSKECSTDTGQFIHRVRSSTRSVVGHKVCATEDLGGITVQNLDDQLQWLSYYDQSAPATPIVVDGRTGTYKKDFLYKSYGSKIILRNNYQVPCEITLYCVEPKVDTSITPATAFTNGLTDVGAPSASSALVYPTDSPQFRDLWNVCRSKKMILSPGQMYSDSMYHKNKQYDPSLFDSHALVYQKPFGCHQWLIRITGCIAHDTTATEIGLAGAGIDVILDKKYEISYAAGIDLTVIRVTDDSSVFTNGAVQSQVVVDNQDYAQA